MIQADYALPQVIDTLVGDWGILYRLMHDQNFKNLILDYPVQSLEFFAREEAGMDLSQARIIPLRQEQLKERLGDRFRELDTPLLVE